MAPGTGSLVERCGERRREPTPKARSVVGIGWERVHVCVDDATRLAYVEVLPDEKTETAIGFLRRALTLYRSHGIRIERLMTETDAHADPPLAIAPQPIPAQSAPAPTHPKQTARPSASSPPGVATLVSLAGPRLTVPTRGRLLVGVDAYR